MTLHSWSIEKIITLVRVHKPWTQKQVRQWTLFRVHQCNGLSSVAHTFDHSKVARWMVESTLPKCVGHFPLDYLFYRPWVLLYNIEEDLVRALTSCKMCVGNKRAFCTTANTHYTMCTTAQSKHVSCILAGMHHLCWACTVVGVLYLYSCGSCTLSSVEHIVGVQLNLTWYRLIHVSELPLRCVCCTKLVLINPWLVIGETTPKGTTKNTL